MIYIVLGFLGLIGIGISLALGFNNRSLGGYLIGTISAILTASGIIGYGRSQSRLGKAKKHQEQAEETASRTRRQDHLENLASASIARCAQRWQAVRAPRALAYKLAKNPRIGALAEVDLPHRERPVTLLVGEIGAGKSLSAERLHQKTIREALEKASSPIPVWLRAQDMTMSLEQEIYRVAGGIGDPSIEGAAVVIDGVEEAGIGRATRLLEEARILAGTWPHTRVLITSRPLPLLTGLEETVETKPLEEDQTFEIINWLADPPVAPITGYSWPDSVREAIRRPFFALLLGGHLRDQPHLAPKSSGELLGYLVEQALGTGESRIEKTKALLKKLAVLTTERDGSSIPRSELGSPEELSVTLETGLVFEHDGLIGYSLPIFTEWFAAHALADADISVEALLKDPIRLEHWFSPMVILAGNFDHDRVSPWLSALARKTPAFASLVVKEGLAKWGLAEDVSPPPARECGRRIREAMTAWVEGLEDLAHLTAPIASDRRLLPIGVNTQGTMLKTSWYIGNGDIEDIAILEQTSFDELVQLGWNGLRSAQPGRQPAWAWRWSFSELSYSLKRLLDQRALPIDKDPFAAEASWRAALALTRRGSLAHGSIPRSEVEDALAKLPSEATDLYSYGKRLSLSPLRKKLLDWRAEGLEVVEAPWPEPDKPSPSHRWIWEPYTDERLLQRATAVLAAALDGYMALVTQWFPRMAYRLDTAAVLPARLDGVILRSPSPRDDLGPSMVWFLDPLPLGAVNTVDMAIQEVDQDKRFDFIKATYEEAAERIRIGRPSAPWIGQIQRSDTLEIFKPTSATEFAYRLLWEDLMRVGWIDWLFSSK